MNNFRLSVHERSNINGEERKKIINVLKNSAHYLLMIIRNESKKKSINNYRDFVQRIRKNY